MSLGKTWITSKSADRIPVFFLAFLSMCFFLSACSDNQGELVAKSATAPTPSQIVSQPAMPAGHPPIGGSGMSEMMGGGVSALSPGPAPELVIEGTTVKVASLVFQIDPAWVSEKPQSSMRAAQFRLPALPQGDGDAEIAIFQGIGGSADANIDRWINQFSDRSVEPKREKFQLGPFTVETVDISGTFNAAMTPMMASGTPKTGYRMIAAVVEGTGKGPWHIKLTGTHKAIESWKTAFDAMIHSLKPVE